MPLGKIILPSTEVFRFSFSLFFLFFFTGCGSFHYLYQAARGEIALVNRARPIAEVIQDERTPLSIKKLLSEVQPIKRYGEHYGLKATSNYQDYVQLEREAAVWVVSACEPIRFKAKDWSFPIVGSVPYLGWFELSEAKVFASDLKKAGWDVELRGAGAFSTLGWFKDPVLSTMISEGALGELVDVILHESVHATLYIKGQTYFNESLASFVSHELTRSYLIEKMGAHSSELKVYDENAKRRRRVETEMHQAYEELSKIFESTLSDKLKLARKQKIISELVKRNHFKQGINNASLIQYKTYNTGGASFLKLLRKCNGDWRRFFQTLEGLNKGSFEKLQAIDFDATIRQLEVRP